MLQLKPGKKGAAFLKRHNPRTNSSILFSLQIQFINKTFFFLLVFKFNLLIYLFNIPEQTLQFGFDGKINEDESPSSVLI